MLGKDAGMETKAASAGLPRGHGPVRRSLTYLLLLLIPLAMGLASSGLREVRGPYWLGSNSDPEYAYLLNSLRLLHGLPPTHRDHPGTPLQVLGALVIQAAHGMAGQAELTDDVIRAPEWYLDTISETLVWIYGLVLLAAGGVVYRKTHNVVLALLFQAAPFLSITSLLEAPRVRPEPLLLILSGLLAIALFLHLHPTARTRSQRSAWVLGALVGLCVATKLTALPLLVIPLVILPTWRSRACALVAALVAFLVGILPMLAYLHGLYLWIHGIVTHQGDYGTGELGIVATKYFLWALKTIGRREPCFLLFVAVSLWASWACVPRLLRRNGQAEPERLDLLKRGLFAVALAQLLQWLLAAKMPRYHYMVPSAGLLGLNLVLLATIALQEGWFRQRWRVVSLVAAIAAAGLAQGNELWKCVRALGDERAHQLDVQREILERYGDWVKVYGYRSSSIEHALYFGDMYSDGVFHAWLRRAYPDPNIVYCDIYAQRFLSSRGEITRDELKREGRKIVFRGNQFIQAVMSDWRLGLVYPGDEERLYAWTPDQAPNGK